MITLNKLRVYKKYSGNIESWDRFGKSKDRELLSYEEWQLIDVLLQKLDLVQKGLASENYNSQTIDKLVEVCDTEDTQSELKLLIGKYH